MKSLGCVRLPVQSFQRSASIDNPTSRLGSGAAERGFLNEVIRSKVLCPSVAPASAVTIKEPCIVLIAGAVSQIGRFELWMTEENSRDCRHKKENEEGNTP